MCLPTAPALPPIENGDFDMSPFCGQLSDKSQLAFVCHMVVRGMKRNRDGKSNAERFLTVQRTASQQPALSPGVTATNELSAPTLGLNWHSSTFRSWASAWLLDSVTRIAAIPKCAQSKQVAGRALANSAPRARRQISAASVLAALLAVTRSLDGLFVIPAAAG